MLYGILENSLICIYVNTINFEVKHELGSLLVDYLESLREAKIILTIFNKMNNVHCSNRKYLFYVDMKRIVFIE